MSGSHPVLPPVRQLGKLGTSAGRELGWGLRAVGAERALWRAHAEAIPDPVLRRDAVGAADKGRSLVDGAALFWTLPPRRSSELHRLLVAFQTLLSFLDVALERESASPDGRLGAWMWLVREALDADAPAPDERIREVVGDDGGYLGALIGACRQGCSALPGYRDARPLLLREAARSEAFELEHDRDPTRRAARLEALAAQRFGAVGDATWWELTGGAGSLLAAMAVLALAADERSTAGDLARAADAYVWVGSAGALLDSYADRADDARTGAHNWFTYYPTPDDAAARTVVLVDRAVREAAALRHGDRHVVIVACMVALALSSASVRTPEARGCSNRIARAGGPMTRLLIPVLRAWRLAYREPSG
jgi:tetraprenyl-beta-curcumene synthase